MPPKRQKPFRHSSEFYRKKTKVESLEPCSSSSNVTEDQSELSHMGTERHDDQDLEDLGTLPNIEDNTDTSDSDVISKQLPLVTLPPNIENEADSSDSDVITEQLSLLKELRGWAAKNNIHHCAINELLVILRSHGKSELPKDARTLLRTPASVPVSEMGNGKFWYPGVKKNLERTLSSVAKIPDTISLLINIDGMSPFDSSSHQFWPITFIIDELRHITNPMVAGIYYGDSKPPLAQYFEEFVEEMLQLLNDGIVVNGTTVHITIKCFVCDTQARSYIKGTPACNAENGSCIKCTVVGEWDSKGRHMSYPRIHCPLRTNESFRSKLDEDHHKEETPLIRLPIDMVEDFVVADSLHLFDLGIMRRCLLGWREGSYNFRTKLSKHQADLMSSMLEDINKTKPSDIRRSIRSLKCLKFWKGAEYRVFLLYLGPVVLKDFVSPEVYEHFLMLNTAVTILSCEAYLKYITVAETLLTNYIETFIDLYGIDSISSNVHNLCHVVNDVKKFGILPNISSYIFENYLGHLKDLVRQGNLPLSQVAKRIEEMASLSPAVEVSLKNMVNHEITETHEHDSCNGVYKEVHLEKNFMLKDNDKDRYFLNQNNEVVYMINATYFEENIHIYGKKYINLHDFYLKPFASSKLNIFATNGAMEAPQLYKLTEVKAKVFCIPFRNEFVFFPLLHTLN